VTEQKTGYITADTSQSRVLICTLAAEVRRKSQFDSRGMSVVKKAQFATAVALLKAVVRLLHRARGQVG
jgi:hypothetical protein